MLSLLSGKSPTIALVNGRPITVGPGETLLQAALRQGIDFPHGCRVGGCTSCKCRLVSGEVRELTETAYILSDDELDQGYILACQSLPRTDVGIEVDLARQPARRSVSGRVIGQEKLTHDITRLRVQLDEALPYKAGQFADITLALLGGVARSYSFASPARADGQVSFFVRRVPGGVFSSLIDERDVVGEPVRVEGPLGDFWLRPADAPILLVAGGSGLAPVLALLEEAIAAGVSRPATLLFGAREARDLYALEEIADIARRWHAEFRFVPVLSEEPAGSSWRGERGLVTDRIPAALQAGSHAYLCGPSAMIDSAVALLRQLGVAGEHIHADRFTTRQDGRAAALHDRAEITKITGTAGTAEAAEAAGMGDMADGRIPRRFAQQAPPDLRSPRAGVLDYLKYFLFHAIGLFGAAAILAGGHYVSLGLVGVLVVYLVGDAVCGDDTTTPRFGHPGILTAQLWLALPLLMLIVFCAVWSVSPGDPLGFGRWLTGLSGYDVIAARDATAAVHHVSSGILTGLMIGMVGTIPAHELTHRTWDRRSMWIGRWLLAFSFDTIFSIEHVYGHHRYVSTEEDPATAPRGRNVYRHILASTVRGNASAWKIERRRLARRGRALFSWHNAVIRGHAMSVLLVAAAWTIGGWRAALFFILCALWGKALLEIVNYMEHYGMVRDPRTPVHPRHSWNTNRRISSWTMFNLTRHSHHHAQGEVPYQDLRPLPDAPMMIGGYLTTILVALVPPLWHRLMTPKVLAWDRDFADPGERRLAARANARSGIPELRQAAFPTAAS